MLLESYRPGVLDRLGFGRVRLRELNPDLIHCALTGYGQSGPRSQDAGHDIGYAALTGGLDASGSLGGPSFNWPPVVDHCGAQQAAISMLGALASRSNKKNEGSNSGRGCFIDVALTDAYLAWQDWGLTGAASAIAANHPARGKNLLNGGSACYRLYVTSDNRYFALGALEPKFWRNFCEALGKPNWVERQSEALPQTALISEVAAEIEGHTLDHWTGILSAVDCCFQAVLTYPETLEDEYVMDRRLLQSGDGIHQVLFPAHVNGNPPEDRASVRNVNLSQAINKWS